MLLWNSFLERRATFANVAALLYAAFIPGLVYPLRRPRRRGRLSPPTRGLHSLLSFSLVAIWAGSTWLLASIPADLSQYREQAVLVPLAVLVRRPPPPLLAVVVVATAAFAVPLTVLYVHGRLL